MDNFDLKKYLTENKLNESPNRLETHYNFNDDFDIATENQIDILANRITWDLVDKRIVNKRFEKAVEKSIKNELKEFLYAIQDNISNSNMYKVYLDTRNQQTSDSTPKPGESK
jgi:hypothetical protein